MAKETPCFAMVDADGNLRIYDIEAQKVKSDVSVPLFWGGIVCGYGYLEKDCLLYVYGGVQFGADMVYVGNRDVSRIGEKDGVAAIPAYTLEDLVEWGSEW